MRPFSRQARGSRSSSYRRYASTAGREPRTGLLSSVLKFSAVAGVSGYAGYALARQIVAPMPVPVTSSLPQAELETIIRDVEDSIERHPAVKQLRANKELRETRPHLKIHEADRIHNLTAGTLAGPGKITVAPYVWGDLQGTELYVICHLGRDMCGHDGIVHGGLLSTLLDEGLARCCFPALPNKIGVTANLTINYRKPTRADQLVMLVAKTTKVEGRKAWVEGRIESLPTTAAETPVTLVEASALFIEPKYAALMKRVVRTDHLE